MRTGLIIEGKASAPLIVDQPQEGYRYTLDPFLLTSFVRLGSGERVIDFGSGVGVIGFVLASLFPDAYITGIEIQRELHEAALKNIKRNELFGRVKSQLGDFRRIEDYFRPSSFTVAVSNPPYYPVCGCRVSKNRGVAVAKHDLMGGVKDIINGSSVVLKKGGSLSMIFPAERYQYLTNLLIEKGFSIKRTRFIHSKVNQEVKTVMLEVVTEEAMLTEVMPPLIVHDEAGNYTDEVGNIFERMGVRSF